MLKVQSLKSIIAIQFATILLPLVGLLAAHTIAQQRRTAELERLHERSALALEARERYTAFANGAADAVDVGRLSSGTLTALADSNRALRGLAAIVDSPALSRTSTSLDEVIRELTADPGLARLLSLAGPIELVRQAIVEAHAQERHDIDVALQDWIEASRRDMLLTLACSALLLALTVWFIYRLTRDLSRPLNFAVSVADRIADGREVVEAEFERQRDVGNLLRSLAAMSRRLRNGQAEVASYQRGLEDHVRQLTASRSGLDQAQRLARMGNWHWEVAAPEAHWSDELYRVFGLPPRSCPPRFDSLQGVVPDEVFAMLRLKVAELRRAPGTFAGEQGMRLPNGAWRIFYFQMVSQSDRQGLVNHMHGTVQDITDRRDAERHRHLAHHDSLTGLPNRAFFREQLEKAVARSQRAGATLATLFIDLDRFKRINDTLGHGVGDLLLAEVAARLNRSVRESDEVGHDEERDNFVARLGGDEFTVTLLDLRSPQDAARAAMRILSEVSRPFVVQGNELVVTASIGLAVFPADGDNADTLLRNADAAMYRAKELGKNAYQFYTEDMNTSSVAKLSLENDLRHALDRGQFVLHYQPKVDVISGRIAGVEALLRWKHPQWGLLPPGRFIAVAEEMGLIAQIGDWVLETACHQLARWREAGLPAVTVAINLACPSLRKPELVRKVSDTLARHRIEPRHLQLEAIESILMSEADGVVNTLHQLRALGIVVAIDDFGTGYSSLSYLRRLPVDQLKIDRSFVQNLAIDSNDAAITAAIVTLGKSLKLDLVAEGVETLAQARALRALGCTTMQGYYFSPPAAAATIERLLRGHAEFAHAVLARMGGLSEPMPLVCD